MHLFVVNVYFLSFLLADYVHLIVQNLEVKIYVV